MNETKVITLPVSEFNALKERLTGTKKYYLAQAGGDPIVLFRHENFLLLGQPQNTLIRSESCKSEDLAKLNGLVSLSF